MSALAPQGSGPSGGRGAPGGGPSGGPSGGLGAPARGVLGWVDAHPAPPIVLAIVAGFAIGALVPGVGAAPDAVPFALIALAIALTLAGVPLAAVGRTVLDKRFTSALLLLSVFLGPLLAFVLSRVLIRDPDLQLGLLLLLLAPGVGLIVGIVRRAGGDAEALFASAPVLLLVQAVTVPGLLILFTLADDFLALDLSGLPPVILATIIAPTALIVALQLVAERVGPVRSGLRVATGFTVPATALAVGTMAAVFTPRAMERIELLPAVAPLFGVYLIVMTPLGILVGTAFSLSIGGVRSLTFAGAARNGLLVLPIAAAFEDGFELVPLVVVLGMAIEVIGLGVYRLLVPSLTQQSRGAYSRD